MTMCSTSRIDPVRLFAGIANALAMFVLSELVTAAVPVNCRNLRRSIWLMMSPLFRLRASEKAGWDRDRAGHSHDELTMNPVCRCHKFHPGAIILSGYHAEHKVAADRA